MNITRLCEIEKLLQANGISNEELIETIEALPCVDGSLIREDSRLVKTVLHYFEIDVDDVVWKFGFDKVLGVLRGCDQWDAALLKAELRDQIKYEESLV